KTGQVSIILQDEVFEGTSCQVCTGDAMTDIPACDPNACLRVQRDGCRPVAADAEDTCPGVGNRNAPSSREQGVESLDHCLNCRGVGGVVPIERVSIVIWHSAAPESNTAVVGPLSIGEPMGSIAEGFSPLPSDLVPDFLWERLRDDHAAIHWQHTALASCEFRLIPL